MLYVYKALADHCQGFFFVRKSMNIKQFSTQKDSKVAARQQTVDLPQSIAYPALVGAVIQRIQAGANSPVQMQRDVLTLQRTIGNQAVGRLLSQVQKQSQGDNSAVSIHNIAAAGVQGTGSKLPHYDKIQSSFGKHDVSHVQAYTGSTAAAASRSIGAQAYATGTKVAFADNNPSLHTAAHEAAHIIQQQAGVQLKGGVGEADDKYERQADAVADNVVQGKSVEKLLSATAVSSSQSDTYLNIQGKFNPGGLAFAPSGGGIATQPFNSGNHTSTHSPGWARIITDNANGDASDPGDPINLSHWKSFAGIALLDDPSVKVNRTLIRMHAINSYFGANTNNNSQNIFLGTNKSNRAHNTEVEEPIKKFLKNKPSGKNHLVDYTVNVNYSGPPQYIIDAADNATKASAMSSTDNVAFKGWANQCMPLDFTCHATYYIVDNSSGNVSFAQETPQTISAELV